MHIAVSGFIAVTGLAVLLLAIYGVRWTDGAGAHAKPFTLQVVQAPRFRLAGSPPLTSGRTLAEGENGIDAGGTSPSGG